MKVQLIGHASLLISTTDCRFLVDPVFVDPHGEGIEEIFPRREVLLDALPEFDVIIISHRHFDHFDIATLSRLPKDVPVFIPEDPLMHESLAQLGFLHVQRLGNFKELTLGQTRLLTTGSDSFVQEFGLVFVDPSGVLWNQVDSVLNAKTIQSVLTRYDRVDLMLAMWQPMLEFSYQMNRSLEFPFAAYGDLLSGIAMVSPRALAPGANGFKYSGDSAWLNRVVFPVAREQFCKDVVDVCADLSGHVHALDPGDGLELDEGRSVRLAETASFIRRLHDNEPIRSSPVRIDTQFIDSNPDHYDLDQMTKEIIREVEVRLPGFIALQDGAFMAYRTWNVIHQLEVAFPDQTRIWTFDFSVRPVTAERGASPIANSFSYITASALFGIMSGIRGWDYALLGGFYRMYQKVYKATSHGLLRPGYVELKDPLALRFEYEAVLEATVLNQVKRYAG
jgi:UDP-MurNAc hydroxylase